MAVSVSWIARRWCIVEQDEQQDLFVKDPWHLHLVDINLRLDVPRERTLCGDLLPSRPIYREVSRQVSCARGGSLFARARLPRVRMSIRRLS